VTDTDAAGPVPPPPAEVLVELPSDTWAALLPIVRRALQGLEPHLADATVRRLRAAPTGRLAGGRVRRELCELLARGGPPWDAFRAELDAADELPPPLDDLRRGVAVRGAPARAPATAEPGPAEADRLQAELERLRSRLRGLREERDLARRQAAGAEQRADATRREVDELRATLEDLEAERDQLARTLEEAEQERRRAVDRAARRHDAELRRLRDELAALRRDAEDRRQAEQRRQEDRGAGTDDRSPERVPAPPARARGNGRLRPGRPSTLPPGVVTGTAEAVELLLHPGRLVLVDGYNVTKQHRGHLTLELQRRWLTQQLAALATRRRVRPVAVFDGEQVGGGRSWLGGRQVEVRFTGEGITADDELVLAVEATDEPVVVVTDDRELRARLMASGADVVGTAPFLWALG
jgi:hypothetical protein